MSRKQKAKDTIPGLDKPDAMSDEEWQWWQDDSWDTETETRDRLLREAREERDKHTRQFLDDSFAKANEASVMQWSDKSQSYEKVNVKGMGKHKKAKDEPVHRESAWTGGYNFRGNMQTTSPTVAALAGGGTVEHKCTHEGIAPVLTLPCTGTQFYAASSAWAREASYLCDMAIDVGANIADNSSSKPFVDVKGICSDGTREAIKSLNAHTLALPPIIRLDWPDMGIPPAGLAFWRALINLLPPKGKVLVACIGSHGRTGTVLASLCIVAMGMDARQAIDHVRKVHCKKAVESMAQEKYLQSLSDAMDRDKGRTR